MVTDVRLDDETVLGDEEAGLELARLARNDLRRMVDSLAPEATRDLVGMYYQIQEFRKAADLQHAHIPGSAHKWVYDQMMHTEGAIKRMLDAHTERFEAGRWAKSQVGIGPVLSAGLLAHLDVRQSRTAGGFWRYAGLDPTSEWLGVVKARELIAEYRSRGAGTRPEPADIAALALLSNRRILSMSRTPAGIEAAWTWESLQKFLARPPFNGKLKVLCWKIGQSFIKTSGRDDSIYGVIYAERKEMETAKNERGDYAGQAAASLEGKQWRENETKAIYETGKLPPGRITLRAARYATKLFLAHLHHVMYEVEYGEPPPKPYVIEHGGHTHYIAPPGWPMA